MATFGVRFPLSLGMTRFKKGFLKMGFEFKILLGESDSSDKALKEVVNRLEKQKKFTQDWPEFSLVLENDGIYVCKHIHDNLWKGLEELEQFLLLNGINYKVEEL